MAKRERINGELLTEEEWGLPFGMGYSTAAERLGLIYLASPEVMLRLLVAFGNEARGFRKDENDDMSKSQFQRVVNQMAAKLENILKGKNPAYMAIPWFTGQGQLRASLYRTMNQARPDDPPEAAWRKDPIRAHARSFMAFFPELSEGAIEGQGRIPNKQLFADHVRKYAGGFLGMDPAMLSLNLANGQNQEASSCG